MLREYDNLLPPLEDLPENTPEICKICLWRYTFEDMSYCSRVQVPCPDECPVKFVSSKQHQEAIKFIQKLTGFSIIMSEFYLLELYKILYLEREGVNYEQD